jgi:membrane-bound serine protease (ClpP class)
VIDPVIAALTLSVAFAAQIPFLPQEEEEEKKEEVEPIDREEVGPPRFYKTPDAKALAEGPADLLDGPVLRVDFDGIVNPGMGEYVISAIARAEREKAQAVLIELDTPGGLVSTTEKIVQAILSAKVPVIVFVTPSGAHAASAGTFITLAGHVAAMSPATRLGAAHPVTGSGKDPEAEGGKHMGRKIENDLVAFVEGIAKERNRNVDWAIDAVKNSVAVNADRALELGVIDLIAVDRDELLTKLDGRQMMIGARKVELKTKGAKVVDHQPSLREKLLNLLADPGIVVLLGILGFIGIMVEAYHPGLIAPGVMGVLCVLASLIGMEQLPIDVGAAILVIAGVGLLIAEMYATTYGLLALLGAISLVGGMLLLIDTGDPSYLVDDSLKLTFLDVVPVVGIVGGFVGYLSFVVLKKRKLKPITGREALIGSPGTVLKQVGPSGGTVFVAGEYWRARSSETIAEKEEIEVVGVEGLELEVKKKRAGGA